MKKLIIALGLIIGISTACSGVGNQLDDWQAVFLTSGQVYYGKITDATGPFYILEDVYYIRRLPPAEEGDAPQLTLVKMGQELHGPDDLIMINRDHILYVENLTPEGQVYKRIQEAKAAVAAGTDAAPSPLPGDQVPGSQMTPEELEQFKKFQEFQKQQAPPKGGQQG